MNLSKPLTANKYDKIVIRLNIVSKEVANETIRDNSEDLLFKSKNTNDDTVIHTIVSCDGGWHKSGYSSLDGIATVISMDNGKFFDTEPMARICKSCLLHAKLRNSNPKRFEDYKLTHAFKRNHIGTTGNMEPEAFKRIWERPIRETKLRYSEFYGDGDSKGFLAVKETYKAKRLECVGRVQKRVGCHLRNLKKML